MPTRLLAFGAALAVCAVTVGAAPGDASRRVQNRVDGYTVVLPSGWHMSVQADGGAAWI